MRVRNALKPFYEPTYRIVYPLGLIDIGVGISGLFMNPRMDFTELGFLLLAITGGSLVSYAVGRDTNRSRNYTGY